MIADLPPDHQAREQALDPLVSFIVQAPAGSGKTELLIQRFLVLLAHASTPEEILAITFTRKAAGEMRSRIIQALQTAASSAISDNPHAKKTWTLARAAWERDQQAGWKILETPQRLRILTIDALCASLVRQMPFLSRLGASPQIAKDPDRLYERAARQLLASLEEDQPWGDALDQLLLHLDNNIARAETLLSDMLRQRDQWLTYLIDYHDPSHLRQHLRDILEQSLKNVVMQKLQKLHNNFPQSLVTELIHLLKFASQQLSLIDTNTTMAACGALDSLPSATLQELNAWQCIANFLLTKDFEWRKRVTQAEGFPAPSSVKDKTEKKYFEEMKERMKTFLDQCRLHESLREHLQALLECPPICYTDTQWKTVMCLLDLLPVLVAYLKVEFQSHGVVDYSEIANCALLALGNADTPTDLALTLDHHIQHILVDEFQDTSMGQCRLLTQLTSGWQNGDGRTLFLVGDPMQSIYRFRKAEVGLFLQAQEKGIGQILLTPLTLTANFRSDAGIVDWINHAFSKIFPAAKDISTGAVAFNPSIAIHPADEKPAVRIYPFYERNDLSEAQTLVSIIEQTLEKEPLQSVAVLVRSKSHLRSILPALQMKKISYRAVEIDTLEKRTIIQDLTALTRALLHPADRIAWLAILRAPWCGLTLEDLYAIAENNSTCIWDRINSPLALTPDGHKRLQKIIPILHRAFSERFRLPIHQWIRSVWFALEGDKCLQNPEELKDARAFFTLIATLVEENKLHIDITNLMRQLETLYATSSTDPNIRVEIMTIHKAKGLEFDTVIVPGLGQKLRNDNLKLLYAVENPLDDGGVDLLMAPMQSADGETDLIYQYIANIEAKKSQHEAGRLLYVAATRAKKQLHLLGHCTQASDASEILKVTPGSLLAHLWEVVTDEFKCVRGLSSVNESMDFPDLSDRFLRRLKI